MSLSPFPTSTGLRRLLGSRRRVAAVALTTCLAGTAGLFLTGVADAGTTSRRTATMSAVSASTPAAPTTVARAKPTADQRARDNVRTAVQRARRGAPIPSRTTPTLAELNGNRVNLGECDYGKSHNDAGGRLCERGDKTADRSLVVLGDSHGKHWVAGLEMAADKYGWSSYYLVKEQCTAPWVRNGDPAEAKPQEPWQACQDFRQFAMDSVAEIKPDLVIVSTSVPTKGVFTDKGYVNNQKDMVAPYKQGFRVLFHKLRQATDGRIVLLRDVPGRKPKTDPLNCFRTRGNTLRDCLSPQDNQAGRVKLVDASVQVAKAYDVQVADPTPWFCWDGDCPASIANGLLPYRNTSHITVPYSKKLTGALADALGLR